MRATNFAVLLTADGSRNWESEKGSDFLFKEISFNFERIGLILPWIC